MTAAYSMDRVPFLRNDSGAALGNTDLLPSPAAVDSLGNLKVLMVDATGAALLTANGMKVQGPVAAAAAAAGNPVPIGGDYNAALPTYTDGQRGMLQFDANGRVLTSPVSTGYSAALTVTRPADQTPYTALDVVGGALTFPTMGPSGGRIRLISSQLQLNIAAVPAGMTSFTLYLYNVTPPSAIADNGAWDLPAGDRASFLGSLALGTPADLGSTLYIEVNAIQKQIKLSSTSLFGYLVTTAGYTPAANSEVYVATLQAVSV